MGQRVLTERLLNKAELARSVKDAAYLEGDFTTRAGKKTSYYIDKYQFETRPDTLDAVTDAMIDLFPDAETYDRIAAPELGAVPLAAVLSIKLKKPYIIVKKQSKGYGTSKMIEGRFAQGDRVVVVEDIITTAGAVLRACEILKDEKLDIQTVIGVINREEGGMANLAEAGFPNATALLTTTDLQTC